MKEKIRILYIEDDFNSRLLVKKALKDIKYEIIEKEDGLSALDLLQQDEKFDLILLDINIAGMNGFEIATRIKSIEKYKNTPLVALTAGLLKNSRELALISGCDGYLTKPIIPSELPNQIEEYLHGKKESLPADKIMDLMREYNLKLVSHLETEIKELKKANEELKELDKLKSNFISLASHELRTPLMTIIGYMGLLLSKNENETIKDNLKILQIIERNAKRLEKIVKDMFTLSLLENKIPFMEIRNINPLIIVESVIEDLRLVFLHREISFSLEINGNIPYIECDEEKITQVISNIVKNAIKYTENKGSVKISVNYPSLTVETKYGQNKKEFIEIAIADTGIGIPDDKVNKIFEKFPGIQNIENHHTSDFEFMGGGMGLGLSISKGIVEKHHGYIFFEKNKPKGTIFYVILPLKIKEDVDNYSFITQKK